MVRVKLEEAENYIMRWIMTLQHRGELVPLDARDANLLLSDIKKSCKILREVISAMQKEEFDKWEATLAEAMVTGTIKESAIPVELRPHPQIKPSISKPSKSPSRKTEPGTS